MEMLRLLCVSDCPQLVFTCSCDSLLQNPPHVNPTANTWLGRPSEVYWWHAAGDFDYYHVSIKHNNMFHQNKTVPKTQNECVFSGLVPGRLYTVIVSTWSGKYESSVSTHGRTCDDTFELHSVQVELEAVEKQIRQLLERQAELRAALESSRDALFPDVLTSGAGTPRTLGAAAAAEDASQATDDDHFSPSAAPGLRDLHPEPLRSPPRDGTRRCDRRRFHRQIPAILKDESVGAIVLHAGVNDIRLRQTEVLKRDFSSLIETVRSTAPATRIIVSGPLPTYRRGHERLFPADGLHPSRVGAELLSDNISRTLRSI
ncbi:hypothetical protein QQF64_006609 [Cirrhinus molitorella]|uniref:Fibronectin type-III domain-containing protein n=1 Tax=Cirrhinus molitorella TaxID=172907 RepID=A0ABR3MBM3_9TELE